MTTSGFISSENVLGPRPRTVDVEEAFEFAERQVRALVTTRPGLMPTYTEDGRCVSLLKILLTNWCQYDCLYCVNRVSSNVLRARFTIDEVVQLTLDFYRRNCIEGLFLSSGIIRSPDYTMEQVV